MMRPCYAAPAAKSTQRPTQEVHAEEQRSDAGVSSPGSRFAGNSQKRDAVSLTSSAGFFWPAASATPSLQMIVPPAALVEPNWPPALPPLTTPAAAAYTLRASTLLRANKRRHYPAANLIPPGGLALAESRRQPALMLPFPALAR